MFKDIESKLRIARLTRLLEYLVKRLNDANPNIPISDHFYQRMGEVPINRQPEINAAGI